MLDALSLIFGGLVGFIVGYFFIKYNENWEECDKCQGRGTVRRQKNVRAN